MLYELRVGLAKDVAYPLKQQCYIHIQKKQKAVNQRPWMKQCSLWRERKVSLFLYLPSTGLYQFLPLFQQKRNNEDVRNRGDQH